MVHKSFFIEFDFLIFFCFVKIIALFGENLERIDFWNKIVNIFD